MFNANLCNMGAGSSAEQGAEDGYPWPEEKKQVRDRALQSGNPKVLDFKQWKFPVEDPVEMIVFDE